MNLTTRQHNYLQAIAENGLCEPKDAVSKRVCRDLCAKKLLRPQPLFASFNKDMSGRSERLSVGYSITAAGRKVLASSPAAPAPEAR